ncbi:helix-turn-helix domain-containing protein [Candidatus Binatia bacterium]|nr:helix-turn-helix domain-containing protein [Candidatus Binatia bacterium]
MKKLTELRQARGWSKAELARRAHLAEGDVGKIESGRLVPYEAQLRRLARVLDVPAAKATTLLDGDESAAARKAPHNPARQTRRAEPTKRKR